MIIKYRADYDTAEITRVEASYETEHFIKIGIFREAKRTSYHVFFDTWKDAHAHLCKVQQEKYDLAVIRAERELKKLNKLKELIHE